MNIFLFYYKKKHVTKPKNQLRPFWPKLSLELPTLGLTHKVPIIVSPLDVNYYCQLSIFEKSAKSNQLNSKKSTMLTFWAQIGPKWPKARLDNELVFQQSDNQELLDSIGSYHYVQIETNWIYWCQERCQKRIFRPKLSPYWPILGPANPFSAH